MRILYFAWVRQRIGAGEENIEIPSDVATVADLIKWLRKRGEGYDHAFSDLRLIRAAVNRTHVKFDHALAGATEVAFFPPVTGG